MISFIFFICYQVEVSIIEAKSGRYCVVNGNELKRLNVAVVLKRLSKVGLPVRAKLFFGDSSWRRAQARRLERGGIDERLKTLKRVPYTANTWKIKK